MNVNNMIIKYYKNLITKLESNEVFVFGSNLQGYHGAGAAKFASYKGWAIRYTGEGLMKGPNGYSYALPTVDFHSKIHSRPLSDIKN